MKAEKIDDLWAKADSGMAPDVLAALRAESSVPPPARLLEGLCHCDLGDHEQALAAFDAVLADQPANIIARLHRAITLHQLGRHRESAEAFRAGPIFPQDAFMRRFMRVFWPARLADSSIARGGQPPLEEVQLPPDAPEPGSAPARKLAMQHSKRGVKAYLAKDLTAAAKEFAHARLLNPQDPEHAVFFAWCLLQRGEGRRARAIVEPLLDQSLAEYMNTKKADEIAHPHLVCEYAWALHDCGEHRQALALLSGVRPSGPDDYWAHIIAALCWTMLGEHKHADACFDIALGAYFLETWDQFLRPFLMNTIEWLESHEG